MAHPLETALELEALFSRSHAAAVGWAERYCGDPALAEDAVQEAFIQMLRGVDTDTLARGGVASLRRNTRWAAHRLVERSRASAQRDHDYGVAGLDEDSAWVRHEARDFVTSICSGLSQPHREALFVRYVEGYPDALCARILGIGVRAFRSRCWRALTEARRSADTAEHVDAAGQAATTGPPKPIARAARASRQHEQ
jgi:DNA-directed RNA polymerase specialized sigma24 family protein